MRQRRRRAPEAGLGVRRQVLLILAVALIAGVTGGAVVTRLMPHLPQTGDAVTRGVVPAATTTGVVHSEVIGYSVQHRAITAYELGDPHATYTAVVVGSMHGYFERAGETVTRTLRATPIPVGLNLWVIDTINPDGDALHQRANAHGVDLNRNWPYLWIPISRTGCTAFDCHYSGPRALSEPETVGMYGFLRKIKPNRLVSIHQPLDGVDTTDGGAIDTAFRNALAHNLNLPLRAFTCNGGCHGNMTGWLTRFSASVAITVEFAQTESATYLSGQATRGILSALMVGVRVPPAPSVGSVVGIEQATGSTAGGNTVTITGTGFTGITAVVFGSTAGTSVKVLSSTKITVVAPKHYATVVNVLVTGTYGRSTAVTADHYTYIAPPAITRISPASGATAGGNTVTITGTGFTGVTAVVFASTAGTSVKVPSSTKITVVAPKHYAAVVNVLVTGTYGRSTAVTADHYTYIAAPAITRISPASGATAGGMTVTITGTGFTGVTAVVFASTAGTSVKVPSSTKITVVAPKHYATVVNVLVTGTYGRSTAVTADHYSFVAPPAITSAGHTVTARAPGP